MPDSDPPKEVKEPPRVSREKEGRDSLVTEFKESLAGEIKEPLLGEIKDIKDELAKVSRQLSKFKELDPAKVDLEKEIGVAAATAARNEKYDEARKWLSLRKDYLDQNALRRRRLFWLVLTGILSAVAVALLVMWLYGEFTPAAAPAGGPVR